VFYNHTWRLKAKVKREREKEKKENKSPPFQTHTTNSRKSLYYNHTTTLFFSLAFSEEKAFDPKREG